MVDYKQLVPIVKKFEGDYSNHPNDKGGPTNRGITLKTFRSFYGFGKSITDLKNMTDAQWFSIFKKGYWDKCKADQIIDQSVANLMVDWCWGSGVIGIKMVQGVVGVKADGIVGPLTLCAINKEDGSIKPDAILYLEELRVGDDYDENVKVVVRKGLPADFVIGDAFITDAWGKYTIDKEKSIIVYEK